MRFNATTVVGDSHGKGEDAAAAPVEQDENVAAEEESNRIDVREGERCLSGC